MAALAIALAAGLGVGISSYVTSQQGGAPTATASDSSAGSQPVAAGSTDLQDLRQDFGPWRQLAGQSADVRPLLLLQNGAAYASERWAVPPSTPGWQQDLGGNVSSVTISGNHAAIADADGVGYTVGVNQPFIVSSNPTTVLLINPGGTVLSMSLAQATAVRQPLAR